jgi:SAM-dependent methyltransferase
MAEFSTRDPSSPEFWNERFAAGITPWDQGGVPPALLRFVAARDHARLRVLIPGCGSAYEAAWLDELGFDVTAIDYAQAALDRARSVLPSPVAARVLRHADFFSFAAEPFDWIYERAFLPALPPALWPRWAARLPTLLAADGELVGLFFIDTELPQHRRGPPFVTTRAEVDSLLGAAFECLEDAPVPPADSLPVFAGRERWMRWRRR